MLIDEIGRYWRKSVKNGFVILKKKVLATNAQYIPLDRDKKEFSDLPTEILSYSLDVIYYMLDT